MDSDAKLKAECVEREDILFLFFILAGGPQKLLKWSLSYKNDENSTEIFWRAGVNVLIWQLQTNQKSSATSNQITGEREEQTKHLAP